MRKSIPNLKIRLLTVQLTLCLAFLSAPTGAADRNPDAVIPVGESRNFTCSSGNGSSYTWYLDAGGQDIFEISDSGSRCTLKAKKPGRTQLWVQYSVTMWGPGQDQYGNWITIRYPDGYEKIGWLVEAVQPCSVTFDRQDGSTPLVTSAYVGGKASPPAPPTRPGSVLDGWYTDPACTRRFEFSTALTGDLTLYAQWLTARNVTFKSLGKDAIVQTVGNGLTASPPELDVPRGYAFEGWYTDVFCTWPYSFSSPVTGDLTLYARWRLLEEAAVMYDCGDGLPPASAAGYIGETLAQPVDPAREGWVFNGWYEDGACTAVHDFSTPLSGDLTLYAKWLEVHTVSFDSQGGSPVEKQTAVHGSQVEMPPEPEMEGYAFDGWFMDGGCTQPFDFDTELTADLTLYAGWRIQTYTVEFVNYFTDPESYINEVNTVLETRDVVYGDTVVPPSDPPLPRDGCILAGWDDAEGPYDFSCPVTEDLRLSTAWLTEPVHTSGSAGETDWTLKDGVLTISGTGETGYYAFDPVYGKQPEWYNDRDAVGWTVIENGVTGLGTGTLRGCYNLRAVELPDSLKKIGDNVFYWCMNLAELDIPDSVDEIGAETFRECESLVNIKLPSRLTVLSSGLFDGCRKLEKIEMPENVTEIGDYAFAGCSSLKKLSIPASVESIGKNAFSGMDNRLDIFYGGTQAQWESIDMENGLPENVVLHYGCSATETLYPVIFDSRGGSAAEEQMWISGERAVEPEAPQRERYSFNGWFKDQLCTEPWDFTQDTVQGPVTLYARWAPDPCVVTFTDAGTRTAGFGEQVEPPDAPVQEGQRFNGWYTAEGRQWLFSAPITEDMTLTAEWLEDERTLPEWYPGNANPNPYLITGWTPSSVTLIGPAERLDQIGSVYAAAYDGQGKLTKIAAGQLSGTILVFPETLSAGMKLFFLDDMGVPLCESAVIQ